MEREYWYDDFGGEYETEEEARERVPELMTSDDYAYYIKEYITYDMLFSYAMNGYDDFQDYFEDEIESAEDSFFNEHFHKDIKYNEEEDEDDWEN